MNQLTFSDMEYSNRKKKTKREEFLDAMEEIIPWSYWVEMIRPYYFANKRGRKPIGIETMLRMYLMQIWFNLSDEEIEDSKSSTTSSTGGLILALQRAMLLLAPKGGIASILLVRYKAVLLESSFLDSSACSFIYF